VEREILNDGCLDCQTRRPEVVKVKGMDEECQQTEMNHHADSADGVERDPSLDVHATILDGSERKLNALKVICG
jgi:hypothetical protein